MSIYICICIHIYIYIYLYASGTQIYSKKVHSRNTKPYFLHPPYHVPKTVERKTWCRESEKLWSEILIEAYARFRMNSSVRRSELLFMSFGIGFQSWFIRLAEAHARGVNLKKNDIAPCGDGVGCRAFNRLGEWSAGTNSTLSSRCGVNNSRCSW